MLASAIVVVVLVSTSIAQAQAAHKLSSAGVLDQAVDRFRNAASTWQDVALGAASNLFWALAAISFVWTFGMLVLRRADLGEVFAEFVRYALFTGFWAWMLQNGPRHAEMIMESMLALGGSSGYGGQVPSPSAIVDVGFRILDRALAHSTILSPLDSACGLLLSLVILVVLALVATNLLVALIACWFVAYGGLIILGFGGSRWTSEMAMSYYRSVLGLALQVLAMVLLVGIGEGFLKSYYEALTKDVTLQEQAVLLVVAIVLLTLVNRVPPLLAGMVSGGALSSIGAGAGASAGMAALSTAGAVVAGGASVIAGSAQSLLGSAVAAASKGSQEGGGAAASIMNAMGGAATGPSSAAQAFGAGGGQAAPAGSVFAAGQGAPASSAGGAAPQAQARTPSASDDDQRGDGRERGPGKTLEQARRAPTVDGHGGEAQAEFAAEQGQSAGQRAQGQRTRGAREETLRSPSSTGGGAGVAQNGRAGQATPAHGATLSGAPRPAGAGQGSAKGGSGKENGAEAAGGAASAPAATASGREPGGAGSGAATGSAAPEGARAAAGARSAAQASAASAGVPPAASTAFGSNGPHAGAASTSPPATQAIAASSAGAGRAGMDTALAGWRWPVAELPRSAPHKPAPVPEPQRREELPAAYRNAGEVDLEAEVAAFANRDET